MLTPKQNFNEMRKSDGKPERFVKQYEPFKVFFHPQYRHRNNPKPGELNVVNNWGVTVSWAKGQPGAFPVHTKDLIVLKDIENWKDYVHAPDVFAYPEEEWEACLAETEKVNRDEYYVTPFVAPGVFEMCHYLMEISNALMALYEYPDEMEELIKYITDWEIQVADVICDHLHPDALLHHDDWGTQISTFMRPDMFEEFFLEPYKTIYGYYKNDKGVECIVHHSDSYAETLVPYMIEMGIDVWQGVMNTNNLEKMIAEYGDKITFMGCVDSATVDFEGWTEDVIREKVRAACDRGGAHHFIPCQSQGLDRSTFPGVYECIDKMIDEYSPIYWKEHGLA